MDKFNYNWDATTFFRTLTSQNRLAQEKHFKFCRVSGMEGFEECLNSLQTATAFVAVSDIAQGHTEIHNTPHTRRVKTIFLAMRHKIDDMTARQSCIDTMRELFRQYMTILILEKTRLEQHAIYLDSRITFNEIDQYLFAHCSSLEVLTKLKQSFSGCACAYFQVAVDIYTDLRYKQTDWLLDCFDQHYFDQDTPPPFVPISIM